ncbi:MAG: DegT/DnrJ/EryC1/StrS family aminotransferase [Planctomycetota bacterium]
MYEIGKPELEAIAQVFESGQTFRYHEGATAEQTARFEQALAAKIGTQYALATSSGTGSLICALVGRGIGPGDEVIVPGYTFIATALAPLAVGAVPIIAEVDETLTLDPKDVEAKITEHTKAIIPVHMLGLPCDMDGLMRVARKHNVDVVEDCAQACGGSYGDRRLGAIGDVSVFSFNHFKILSCGEGGAVVTNDRLTHQRAMIQHDGGCVFFSREARETAPPMFAGLNFRISEIGSAILNVQLGRLDGILAALRERKQAMAEIFTGSDKFRLSPVHDVPGDCAVVLALEFDSADAAQEFSKAHGEVCSVFRPIETDRHVYTNWEPIIAQRAHHPEMNPWHKANRTIQQDADCCPRTLDVLARTVCIHVPYQATVQEARELADKLA